MHLNWHKHLSLYLPSEIEQITLQSGIQEINAAFKCIKTIFICIYLCICILPLYLHSEMEKITLQSDIKEINAAFRA